MSSSLLDDAFGHHVWATLRLIDACTALTAEQLESSVPGTRGPILETLRHTVGGDSSYLFVTGGGRVPPVDTDAMTLPELRAVMERHGPAWAALLAEAPDPDAFLVRHREDGTARHAATGIRLAQALHHGTDHRSQICTALTALGIEPPGIDVWDYGFAHDRMRDKPAPS